MDKILNLDSVDLYNKLYGLETLNPLVSVIDLNKATSSVDLIHPMAHSSSLQLRHLRTVSKTRESLRYQIRTPDIRLPRRHDRLLRPRTNCGNKSDNR